jgi:CRP/FNR family transcriptional regulator
MPSRLPEPRAGVTSARYESLPCPSCPGKHLNLCRPLDRVLQAEFHDMGMRQRWARRELLFRAGDPLGPLFKVTSGVVAVSKSLSEGQRQILRFVLPGDVCGYLDEGGHYSFDGEAITEVATCTFPRAEFDAFVARNRALGEAVRSELSEVLKTVSLHMTAMGQMSSTPRVANFLCDMREMLDSRGLQGRLLGLPMTRTDIADYLGLRLETVSRAFSELRRRKLIEPGEEGVVILDLPQLARLAGRRGGRRDA